MRLNGFDKIAFVYDFLAKLVFGKQIVSAQSFFLNRLPARAKVLILGGGTGWILAKIFAENPGCEVWYIEASSNMIGRAKSRVSTSQAVQFIHGTEENIPSTIRFDAVMTNFYLDLFDEHALSEVVARIHSSLAPDAIWLATDFVNKEKLWQRALLAIMYRFFRFTCAIESSQLPDWKSAIMRVKYETIAAKSFYHGFIEAVYVR